jgi:hypothetical protein
LDGAWGVGQASLGLGLAAKSRGDKEAAIAHLSRAIVSLVAAADATILGVAMSTLGGLTFREDPQRAVRLAAAASASAYGSAGSIQPAPSQSSTRFAPSPSNGSGGRNAILSGRPGYG